MGLLKKLKRKYKIALLLVIIGCFSISFLYRINGFIVPQLMAIAHQQANNAISTLCQRVLGVIDYDVSDLIIYEYDAQGKCISVQYNTKVLNRLLKDSLDTLQVCVEAAARGEEDPILKEVIYDDGVIYRVPIGYLTGISLLQDKGYEFQIGLRTFDYVNGDLDIVSQPYGINSSLITISLGLNIRAEAMTAFHTETVYFEESIPIVVQVVQGDVPAYVPSIKNE